MKAQEKWDSMIPEERVYNGVLENLANWILESDWKDLPEYIKNTIRILLT